MASMASTGFEKITGLSSAKGLTVPDNTLFALIQATTQNVRVRFDGTNPDATTGLQLVAGAVPKEFDRSILDDANFIEEASSAALQVQYFGQG